MIITWTTLYLSPEARGALTRDEIRALDDARSPEERRTVLHRIRRRHPGLSIWRVLG